MELRVSDFRGRYSVAIITEPLEDLVQSRLLVM